MNITTARMPMTAIPVYGARLATTTQALPQGNQDQVTLSSSDNRGARAAAWIGGTAALGGVLGASAASLTGVGSHIAGALVGAAGGVVPGLVVGAMLGSINDTSGGWGGLGGGIVGGAAGGVIGAVAGGFLGSSALGGTLGAVAGVLGGAAGGFVMHIRTAN